MPFHFDNSYARLSDAFHVRTEPTRVRAPAMIRLNRDLADDLGLDVERLESPSGLEVLSGNRVTEGSEPLAMAYSGHQFGGFSPQLGDGRALLLGEVVGKDGVRRDIQLKGSGPTPFSRGGDGRSALGPVLREYIVSEAMAALGVPTTRALAAVATGEPVFREATVPGGVLTRVAKSHIRVGTFQWFSARKDRANLAVLADYVIARHYPEAKLQDNPYRALLDGVIERQAELVAHWMSLGFIHGVMNTDNTNVSGETLDYGPCAFLDHYDPEKKFSSIDHHGRYAFDQQPAMAQWNLYRLAECLLPLIHEESSEAVVVAEASLDRFADLHRSAIRGRFLAKIGLAGSSEEDWPLAESLLSVMAEGKADFTLVFRHLARALASGSDDALTELFDEPGAIAAWLPGWRARIGESDRSRAVALMRRTNPVFIPRNHRIEEAIQAGNHGDFEPFHLLADALKRPFADQPEFARYEAAPNPDEVVRATFCGT